MILLLRMWVLSRILGTDDVVAKLVFLLPGRCHELVLHSHLLQNYLSGHVVVSGPAQL